MKTKTTAKQELATVRKLADGMLDDSLEQVKQALLKSQIELSAERVLHGAALEELLMLKHAYSGNAVPELEWLWANCKIVFWPKDGSYPIEHNPHAGKDSRGEIEASRRAALSPNAPGKRPGDKTP